MSDVKSVKINDDARDVKDALAREQIGDVSELHTSDKTTLVDAINEVFDNDSDDDGKIGNLSNLMTDSKSNLVGAINEVYQSADDANDAIGDLSNLTTQNKGNIVGAVNELVGSISDTNDDVTAIANRVTTAEGDIDDIEGNIGDLSGLHTTDKNSLVEAINETLDSVGDVGDVNLPDLTNIQNTVDAINGVIAQTNSDLTTLTNRVQSDEDDIAQNSTDIGDLKTAVGDVEDVTDLGYNDLSDAIKQIYDNAQIVESTADNVDARLGTNSNLSEPYADQIAANKNHIGDLNYLNVNGRDLVDACNYLLAQIGTLSNLSTTDKTSLVAAINEVAQSGGGSGGSGGLVKVAEYTTSASILFSDAINNLATAMSENISLSSIYLLTAEYGTVTDYYISSITQSDYIQLSRVVNYTTGNKVDSITIKNNASRITSSQENSFTATNVSYNVGANVKFTLYKLGISSGGSGGKTEVASVTADGVKTYSQLLTELYNQFSTDVTKDYALELYYGSSFAEVLRCVTKRANGEIAFSTLQPTLYVGNGTYNVTQIVLQNSPIYYAGAINGGNAPSNMASGVPTSGDKIIVYEM